jgi:hypothetical protein
LEDRKIGREAVKAERKAEKAEKAEKAGRLLS